MLVMITNKTPKAMLVLTRFSLKIEGGIFFFFGWSIFQVLNSTVSQGIFLQNPCVMFAFNLMSVVFFHVLFTRVIDYVTVKRLLVALFPYKKL